METNVTILEYHKNNKWQKLLVPVRYFLQEAVLVSDLKTLCKTAGFIEDGKTCCLVHDGIILDDDEILYCKNFKPLILLFSLLKYTLAKQCFTTLPLNLFGQSRSLRQRAYRI